MARHPFRIAVVAPPFYQLPPSGYGGIELVCYLLAEALVARGHDVTLIGAGTSPTRARFYATFPEPRSEYGAGALEADIAHAARSADLIGRLDPDVVHDHSRLGPLTARSRQSPTVVTTHAPVSGPDSCLDQLAALQHWVHLVAVSPAQRRLAPELAWTATVPHGIDVDTFPLGTVKDDFLLYLGRLSATKGVGHAVAAARELGRRLVIAGSWTVESEHRYFQDEVAPLLGPGVDWLGEVRGDRKVELLRRAACLVFPTRWQEPFGLVLIEAMACGTPVAAIALGAVPDLVVDGVTGALCTEPEQLPAAVERAVRLDPAAIRSHVVANFSVDRMADGYERVYRSVLAGEKSTVEQRSGGPGGPLGVRPDRLPPGRRRGSRQ
jgi:glycosyltransferase involved in cell wall biosynthesis